MLKLPDGTVKVLVEGVQRAETKAIHDTEEHFTAESGAGAAGHACLTRGRGAAPCRDTAV